MKQGMSLLMLLCVYQIIYRLQQWVFTQFNDSTGSNGYWPYNVSAAGGPLNGQGWWCSGRQVDILFVVADELIKHHQTRVFGYTN